MSENEVVRIIILVAVLSSIGAAAALITSIAWLKGPVARRLDAAATGKVEISKAALATGLVQGAGLASLVALSSVAEDMIRGASVAGRFALLWVSVFVVTGGISALVWRIAFGRSSYWLLRR